MYTYILTEHAVNDLQAISDYITFELCAPESAAALLDRIAGAIEKACSFPYSLPILNDTKLQAKGYRKLLVNHYIIFVIPDEATERLYVMRVLYHAQDYQRYL